MGYVIFNNGVPWIEQPANNIPYPGATMEESAQNHINKILADYALPPTNPIEDQLNELMIAVAELGMSAEQDKMETQVAIAELAMLVTGGEV
ncbi:hypothetical protein MKY29_00635 [Psychrobacillus sp. FSL K6-2365]|uniref:hypothetical protein n=1 Tax=Psychrobacillus sp. FSL K6-2365 TaxID=2921546 RepID=UPI0030FAA7AC